MTALTVIGGGLAGCEAAWQAARRGVRVRLVEMRPERGTGAHRTGDLAELVCSNSLGSNLPDRATGVLLNELRALDSLLIRCADATAVPAGGARAVDRTAFSAAVSAALASAPGIEIVRAEATEIPEGAAVLASGPLTSPGLSEAIARFTGREHFFFFDAIAPMVTRDSVNRAVAFRASRREETAEGDYLNCPMDRDTYERFVDALLSAERHPLREFEEAIRDGVRAGAGPFFEGCLPVEVLAGRSREALRYGPLRPIGLRDPRTGRRPWAVLQLRQDNLAGTLYSLVGFQTNLRPAEQDRVFRMIPGLEQAEFVHHGQMHRNTFIQAPLVLDATLETRERRGLFFAGQLTGVEGYAGNIATGWLAGVNAARRLAGREPLVPPADMMMGALVRYVAGADAATFQPMKANFGILPPLPADDPARGKRMRAQAHARQAAAALGAFIAAGGGESGAGPAGA